LLGRSRRSASGTSGRGTDFGRSREGAPLRRMLAFALVVALLGFGSFFYFKVFYAVELGDFSNELTVAFLGSVITVAITAVLLHAQVVSEVRREKSVGVFQEKLALYKEFVEFLNSVVADNRIAADELVAMRAWALKLSLVAGWGLVAEINRFIEQTMKFKKHCYSSLTDAEKEEWRRWYAQTLGAPPGEDLPHGENPHFVTFGRIVADLKEDLGVESVSKDLELGAVWRTIDGLLRTEIHEG
jgi:hypothetical protein